jgi:hypothetical protein
MPRRAEGGQNAIAIQALNYHLIPTMPSNRVRVAHVIVRGSCEELGIPYQEVSTLQSHRELLGFLHEAMAPPRARGQLDRARRSRP